MATPLRVLLVAPVHDLSALRRERVGGWSGPFLPTQPQSFWMKALVEMGHDVRVVRWSDSLLLPEAASLRWADLREHSGALRRVAGRVAHELGSFHPARARIRRAVVDAARQVDLVVVSGGSSLLDASLVADARTECGGPVIQLNGTSPSLFASPAEKAAAPEWDLVVCNERFHALEWIGLGARRATAVPVSACDPSWHRPLPAAPVVDVTHVGVATPHRRQFMTAFLDAVPDGVTTALSGPGWERYSHPKVTKVSGRVSGSGLREAICAGTITLSVQEPSMLDGGSLRNFEATACGTALVVDRLRPDWFAFDEVVRAPVPLAAADAVVQLLHDPARTRELAERGRARCLRDHTYWRRWQRIIAVALGEEEAEDPRTLLAT